MTKAGTANCFQQEDSHPTGVSPFAFTVSTLAALVLVPLALIGLGLVAAYRELVKLILKLRHGPEFGGLVEGCDSVHTLEHLSKDVTNSLFVLGYDETRPAQEFYEKLKALIADVWFQDPDPCEKFKYTFRVTSLGYVYRVRCRMGPDDCIKKMRRIATRADEMQKDEFVGLMSECCNSPISEDDRIFWGVQIGTQPLRMMVEGGGADGKRYYPVVMRVHHAIADGASLLTLLNGAFGDDPEIAMAKTETSQNSVPNGGKNDAPNGGKNPISNGEKNPTSNGGKNPTTNEDKDPISNGDKSPISNGGKNPTSNEGKDPISNGDKSPIPNGGKNTAPNGIGQHPTYERLKTDTRKLIVHHIKEAIQSLTLALRVFCLFPYSTYAQMVLRGRDSNLLHGRPLSGTKIVAWTAEETETYVSKVKRIKDRVKGTTFPDVMFTALSASLSDYYKSKSEPVPEYICSMVPVLPGSSKLQHLIPGRFGEEGIRFTNGFSTVFPNLFMYNPDQDVEGSPLIHTLRMIAKDTRTLKNSVDYYVNYITMSFICPILPRALSKLIVLRHRCTVVASIVAGPKEMTFDKGRMKLVHAGFWATHFSNTGLSFSALTYGGRLHVGLNVDEALISDRGDIQNIVDSTFRYLDRLEEDVRNLSRVEI